MRLSIARICPEPSTCGRGVRRCPMLCRSSTCSAMMKPTPPKAGIKTLVEKPLLASVGSLARSVASAPKKRSEKVLRTPAKAVRHAACDGDSIKSKTSKKTSPCHRFRKQQSVSMSRKCVVSRAFHHAERLARSEGCSETIVKQRRQIAHKEAGIQWDKEHNDSK